MIELSETEKNNWMEQMRSRRGIDKTGRVQKIIELSREGKTLKEIQREVGGAFEIITETRMRARRQGLL